VDSFVDKSVDNFGDRTRPGGKITIIFNPVAGNRRDALLHDTVTALVRRGFEVSVIGTTGPGNATDVAKKAVNDGVTTIVAAGGDGTINEVVSGVVGSDIPVGIIPMGTANVLALEFRLPRRAKAIADVIAEGATRRLHIGRINGRRFLLMVGAGFDGQVVHAVDSAMKRRWGKYAFVLQGLRAVIGNPARKLSVDADGTCYPAAWAVITNISSYGGPYTLLPGADPGAKELTAILFQKAGRLPMCCNLIWIGLGIAVRSRSVNVVRAMSFRLSSPEDAPVPVQIDGDAAGTLPVQIDATDQFVLVRCPPVAR
jgi:diacylglycerol kinase (ATP)